MIKRILRITAAVVLVVLTGAFLYFKLYFESDDLPLDHLETYDLEGHPAGLADYAGKPLVVNFWSSWCRPCLKEFPYFAAMQEVYGEEVNFVMVSDEPVDKIRAFAAKHPYSFTYLHTTRKFEDYGIRVRPTTYFYTAAGRLVGKHTGSLNTETLENRLVALRQAR